MANEQVLVIVQIGQGNTNSEPMVGKLIYENGEPFAELPSDRPPSCPQKVALVQGHLKLDEESSPGRPAMYRHDTIIPVPDP